MRSTFEGGRGRTTRRLGQILSLLLATVLLQGCLLISGAQQSADRVIDAGNVTVQFVSAEGTELRQVQAADEARDLDVTVYARAERGQLRIEVLDAQNSVRFVIEGAPEEQIARGIVPTDAQGMLRFRIRATGAQRGGFQILYQPADA